MTDERATLAADAFIYGFPLVFNLSEVSRFVRDGMGEVPATPFNRFGHASKLAGPEATFVSINNDTLYSIAQVDLSAGPVQLDVPDTSGRYYVLQFLDAWTNNFAYVGHRATGTRAGSFLLVPPDTVESYRQDVEVIRFPTKVATIVGRWSVNGHNDLPAVSALQAALTLSPASDRAIGGLPPVNTAVADGLFFFEQLRVWMQTFPPAARDVDYQARFDPLGLFEPESPYSDPDPELAASLREGLAQGRAEIESAVKSSRNPKLNGWSLTYHVFDYNLDFFEVGALNDPKWKVEGLAPRYRYLLRAGAARGGLWGNHGYEAAYAMVYEDDGGHPLNGSSRYWLRFDEAPPVGAFWSVTMYEAPDFFLVANSIGRYSIGDRTPGLHSGVDGSLTIFMQAEEPDSPEERANWLPTPLGDFRPILRMYEPSESILDGTYKLPPIIRR